ncbi:probable ATP-dependent RNA helicase ddx42 [Drosophila grimshawi]|uniref:probable ATP-dependent RNA helicase ddx42 n=1 Tax=Drosophila grimshawi TaxID=7222 RepID=UPI0013EF338E|nr:probable ATP-dependent RNA helicase ddx42 [Drosophila grimshawi]
MSQGCPCKNAKEMNSSCAPCGENATYQSHNEGYINDDYQNDYQCGRQYPNYGNDDYYENDQYYENYQNYRNYQGPNPTDNDNYYGNQYGQDQYGPNGDDENANSPLSDSTKSLLKAIAVFSAGCFLTMQLTNVANELG